MKILVSFNKWLNAPPPSNWLIRIFLQNFDGYVLLKNYLLSSCRLRLSLKKSKANFYRIVLRPRLVFNYSELDEYLLTNESLTKFPVEHIQWNLVFRIKYRVHHLCFLVGDFVWDRLHHGTIIRTEITCKKFPLLKSVEFGMALK